MGCIDSTFYKLITGPCPVSFLATRKNILILHSTFFPFPDLQESIPPVSFDFAKGKKLSGFHNRSIWYP